MHTCVCDSVWSAYHTHKPSSQRAHARDDPLLHVHLRISTRQVLKRKKMYEAQRDQLAAQSFNVDQVRRSLDQSIDRLTWLVDSVDRFYID